MTPLQEIRKIIVHDAILESITDFIRDSGLAIGERIPSERNLAESLKVSRSSVRGALKALESAGVLEIRHGGGAFLRSQNPVAYYQYTDDHRDNLILLKSLVQARQAIEEWVVTEAATAFDSRAVDQLREMEDRQMRFLTGAMPVRKGQSPEFEFPNMEFEVAITRLFGNPFLLETHERIAALWKQSYRKLRMTPFPPAMRHEHHQAIIEGIGSKRPVRARKAMAFHNRSLEQYITAAITKLDADNHRKE